jgi:GMP synthase (glutamine-hydrolysing)
MPKLLIIQNITRESPGLINAALKLRGVEADVINLDGPEYAGLGQAGAPPLPSLDGYDGLVVMGGPDSANDTTPKMTFELNLVRDALSRHLPYLGICLGLQVLVKAAGGQVVPAKVKEIGFRDATGQLFKVELTVAGQIDPVFGGLQSSFNVFQLHGETVTLTPDMILLGTSEYCPAQIVRVGRNAYGIQSHFEVTPELLADWADQDPDLIHLPKSHLLADYTDIQQTYRETAITIFGRFLDLISTGREQAV